VLLSSNQAEFQPDPCLVLDHWIDQVESVLEQKSVLPCLCNDERLGEFVEGFNGFCHVIWNLWRWIVLLSGLCLLDAWLRYWSSYLINAYSVHIGLLDYRAARDPIVRFVHYFPSIYMQAAIEIIFWLVILTHTF